MYYPEELVEEIRERNDIVDVISGYVKLQRKELLFWPLPFSQREVPLLFRKSGKTDVLLLRLRGRGKCVYLCYGI